MVKLYLKNKAKSIFTLILMVWFMGLGLAFSDPIELPPIDFGGGLNLKTAANQINDNQSPDMSNMINAQFGASVKRNGSKRYIEQAISSNPITGLYRAYASSGTAVKKALLATTWDGVFVSTTEDVQNWVRIVTGTAHNQHYSFVTMNNKVIFSAHDSTENSRQYDIVNSSLSHLVDYSGSTEAIRVRGKYLLNTQNYLIMANCADLTTGTTFYPSRIYYSLLAKPNRPQ
jgi:hypothetical protein